MDFLIGSYWKQLNDHNNQIDAWALVVDEHLNPLYEANLISRVGSLEQDVTDIISRCGTLETNVADLQNNKQNKFIGTTSQYVRGDGSLIAFPSIPAAQQPSDWSVSTGVTRILNKPTIPAAQIQSDWNQTSNASLDFIKNKPVKSFGAKVTVASGNAIIHLTSDGTAGGAAFFASGPNLDTLQITPEEGTTPHYPGTPVLSNSNKTLTVPITKAGVSFLSLLGLNVLTGSPVAANGSIVRILVTGNS